METRRTNQFLRFALGARSPDRKKYYKNKLYTAPGEARLKIKRDDEGHEGVNNTMYNQALNSSLVNYNQ